MNLKMDPATAETCRQEFMAGTSLRDLAAKHGLSLRTLATYSRAGGWDAQRKLQRTATAVPALMEAVEARVEAVRGDWSARIAGLIENMGSVAERAGDLLARQKFTGTDFRDLASLMRVMIDGIAKLKEMAPAAAGGQTDAAAPVRIMTDDERTERIAELLERARARGAGPAAERAD
jgi:hypothetical protein